MTSIMPPEHSLSLTRIMPLPRPSQSWVRFPGRCHIWDAGLTSIMASEVTRIVVPFWLLFVYLSLTRIMAPPLVSGPILASICLFESDSNNGPSLGHLNLLSDGATSVHVSYLWLPGRGHIWSRAAGLTSIMVSEVTQIVAPFCPPPTFMRV